MTNRMMTLTALLLIAGCTAAPDLTPGIFGDEPRQTPFANEPKLQQVYLRAYWDGMKHAVESGAAGSRHFDDFFPQTPVESANARGYWDADFDAEQFLAKARMHDKELLRNFGVADDILEALYPPVSSPEEK